MVIGHAKLGGGASSGGGAPPQLSQTVFPPEGLTPASGRSVIRTPTVGGGVAAGGQSQFSLVTGNLGVRNKQWLHLLSAYTLAAIDVGDSGVVPVMSQIFLLGPSGASGIIIDPIEAANDWSLGSAQAAFIIAGSLPSSGDIMATRMVGDRWYRFDDFQLLTSLATLTDFQVGASLLVRSTSGSARNITAQLTVLFQLFNEA